MAWVDAETFTDGQIVRAYQLRRLQDNITSLRYGGETSKTGFVDGEAGSTQTIGTTLAKLTSPIFEFDLEVEHGGDVLVYARALISTAAVTTGALTGVSLYVDGEVYPTAAAGADQTFWMEIRRFNTFADMLWIVNGLSIGTHTFELYMRRAGVTVVQTAQYPRRDGFGGIEL